MADNSQANTGAGGDIFATDDIVGGPTGNAKWPFAKLAWGALDTANVVDDASGKRIPVKVGDPLPTGSNTIGAVNQGTAAAVAGAWPILVTNGTNTAGVTAGGGLSVDIKGLNGSGIATGNGVSGGGVLRVAQVSDGTGKLSVVDTITNVVHVDDNAGSLTVDAPVATPVFVRLSDGAAAITALPVTDNAGSLTIDTPQLPAALVGGRLDENVGAWLGSTAPTVGSKTSANSVPVVVASDQGAIPVSQSGTWNVGTVTTVTGITNVVHVDDNAGSLTVDNGGTFAVQETQVIVDNAAFTDGTSKLFMAGYILDDTAGTALTENDAAAPRISTNRATVGVIEDGATRARYATVSAANALKVDGSAVTQPVSLAANQSVNVAQINGVTPLMGNGVTGTGSQRVTVASDNTPFTVNAQPLPSTTGGLTIGPGSGAKLISAATTNATSVKGSAGQLYFLHASNINAAVRYVKLYNKASAPTVGTDVPVLVFAIPGNTAGAGFVLPIDMGIAFATGIALSLNTGVADADTGAVAANEIVINMGFK